MTMLAAPESLVALQEAWRAWEPVERPVRSEWCEAHIQLSRTFSANRGGPFTFVGREYLREILDSVDEPDVDEVVFVAVPQIGKTTLLHALVQSQGEVDAAPMMFAGPDQMYIREQRTIIYDSCEETPILRDRIPPPRLRNDRAIDLESCYIYLAWSGSTQRLSGRACKIVLCSEADRWKASVELAKQRTKAFWRGVCYFEGSPVRDSPVIYPLYRGSDRRTFRVPCPSCGHHQELRFFPHKEGPYAGKGGVAGLRDEAGNWRTPEEARKAAHYVCEQGCRIDTDQKPAMIRRGRWAAEGQRVDRRGRVVGKPAHAGRRRGYRLNALYSPTCTFGDIAEAYLRLRDTEEGLQSFFNDWLGLAHKPRGRTPQWEELGRRLAGSHRRGEIPPWAYFLIGAADVQADRVYWIVRAWGDGCTSALVDWGELRKVEHGEGETAEEELASDLAQIDAAILDRKWPVLGGSNPLGYSELAVCRFGVDAGYRPTEVYSYVRARPGDRVLAVAGDPKISPGILYRIQRLERNVRTGEVYPEGTERWGIDTNSYKSDIMGRWTADRRLPGVWWLPADVLGVPGGEDYLRQITNERREQENRAGKKLTRWIVISPQIGNHYWDAEVYGRALADMVVGQEWDASKWPWIQPAAPTESDDPDKAPPDPSERFSERPFLDGDFSAR